MTAASSLPCPWWCEKPPGHGFIAADCSGNLQRFHAAWFGEGVCSVELSALETAASNDGPVDPGAPTELGIWVNNPGDHQFTGPQARALAVALGQAADVYERARP